MNDYGVPIKDIKIPDGYEAVDFRELTGGDIYVAISGKVYVADWRDNGVTRLIISKQKPKLKLQFNSIPLRVPFDNFNNSETITPGMYISFTTEFRDKNGNNPQTMYAYATVVES